MEKEELIRRIIECDFRKHKLNLLKELGLCGALEMRVLREVSSNGGELSISVLTDGLQISRPNLSRTLKNMEEAGKIVRKADKRDRRNTIVCITENGSNCLEGATEKLREFFYNALDRISSEELTRYYNVSETIYAAYLAELAEYKRNKN